MKKRHKLALASASIALGFGGIQAKPAEAAAVGPVDVYAAASLNGSLQAAEALYKLSNPDVTFNNTFGASGTLVNQILTNTDNRNIDVFFPVSEAPLDTLQSNGKLVAGTRQDVVGNTLAIIQPTNSTVPISSVQDLVNVTRNVIIGNPATVPAGQFAQQLFRNSGISLQPPKLVYGTDVRDVLNQVSSITNDTIDAGVVYTTDALTQPDLVKIAYTPPTNLYSPIVYGSAVLAQSQNLNAARDFNSFLGSPQAFTVFQSYGFTKPVPEPLTIGGTIAAGLFGVAMKRKAAKAKAKAAVN
ncbi:MAG: molybdate ABC transporter substrate-binding protein [Brasilonema octagenarum HA4186-MV1]|jgi:molybdate transport system substrate-binding protein|uniref:Molybdate ABC transporter substrate-binding protein n=2 Tax=Brasilonema TaxID=383614 RepID=A0A856MM19_9CYAN|nr:MULTISPECIES: molybdate ABC transporter substrate-binding protein [Brasilonema]MBW4625785.1 molybdate ABC transporter substrate-binding protein [Brasilonema octagenarum HA4186-MV1]NMF66654.1 molybdate ABC transporter substrate-binding protein [Brasilonema octagenarum UFV-OR1]QDL12485.1 molybdate ABC transporter substrate-binding protein [Brasilonema sennae CENA114]QDL18880.1 molybdate ABC transporter substrate-binding protein [Brasilonema octagenarum UFV-E1]